MTELFNQTRTLTRKQTHTQTQTHTIIQAHTHTTQHVHRDTLKIEFPLSHSPPGCSSSALGSDRSTQNLLSDTGAGRRERAVTNTRYTL